MAVAPAIDNVFGFELLVTQSSNFTMTFFIQPIQTKAGKKEFLKIFIKACKSARLLVHGRRGGVAIPGSSSTAYRFNTQSFLFEDQQTLVQALKYNFGIFATIQKDRRYYRL